jgi:hypothetical protein
MKTKPAGPTFAYDPAWILAEWRRATGRHLPAEPVPVVVTAVLENGAEITSQGNGLAPALVKSMAQANGRKSPAPVSRKAVRS